MKAVKKDFLCDISSKFGWEQLFLPFPVRFRGKLLSLASFTDCMGKIIKKNKKDERLLK